MLKSFLLLEPLMSSPPSSADNLGELKKAVVGSAN
jgi:hypothetical protein